VAKKLLRTAKFTTLSRKILFYILLCSSTITLLLTLLEVFFEYKTEINGIDRQFKTIEVSYLPSLSENIWLYNMDGIHSQIKGIYSLSDIVYVSIRDELGTEVYFSDRQESKNSVVRTFELELFRNNRINKLGDIQIHATLDNVYSQLWNRVIVILIGQGVKTFLVSFVILLLIFHFITRRLSIMNRFISGIGNSDDINKWPTSNLQARLNLGNSQPDELNELAQAIDLMSDQVRQLYFESEEQRRRLSQVFEGSHDAIIIINLTNKNIVDFNSKACEMLDFSKQQLQQSSLYALHSDHKTIDDFIEEVERVGWCVKELSFNASGRRLVPTETSASIIYMSGITYLLATCRDIRERKKQEAQVDKLMHFDSLTGLPNRLLIRERISQAMIQEEIAAKHFTTMLINIDNFKTVNDALGQYSGDLLIKMTAQMIKAVVGTGDTLGRLSADEFILLAQTGDDVINDTQLLADSIRKQFSDPMVIAGEKVKISVSVGCTLLSEANDVDEVLRFSDLALCKAKADGRDRVIFYQPDMDAEATEKLSLNTALHHALKAGEYELFYQPIIDLNTLQTVSVECLLRWRREDGSLVSPAQFIPALVSSGLIIDVGAWVIEEACTHMAALDCDVSIAINVSPIQLESDAIIDHVKQVLQKTGLPANRLVIEITEDLVIQDQGWAITRLRKLRDLGLTVALDDFGTGYSSLAYLKMLPVNKLKIDQSFVRDMLGDPEDSAIVETIISIAKALKLELIAEGVETQEQADHLKALGCEHVQGYYYQRPQPILEKSIHIPPAQRSARG
jgi:diguanylate cyclase (GGDEF)-like protein/PAS domain S-box-containing protein